MSQVPKWIEDNKLEFMEGGDAIEDTKKIMTPSETQSKLLQLMNADESCDCIRGWVQVGLCLIIYKNKYKYLRTNVIL